MSDTINTILLSTTAQTGTTISFTGWLESINKVIDLTNQLYQDDFVKEGNLTIKTNGVGAVVDTLIITGDCHVDSIAFGSDGSIMSNIGVTERLSRRHIDNLHYGTEGDEDYPIYNPHKDSTSFIDLDKVDNTAFKDKPISNATQKEIDNLNEKLNELFQFTDKVTNGNVKPVMIKGIKEFFDATIIQWVEQAYPIGTVYRNDVDDRTPNEILGFGNWSKLNDGVVTVSSDGSNTWSSAVATAQNSSKVGVYNRSLTTLNIPEHNHSTSITSSDGNHAHNRGNMNLTAAWGGGYYGSGNRNCWGAIWFNTSGGGHYATHEDGGAITINMDASRSWSGGTSWNGSHNHTITLNSVGSGKSFSIVQPYYCTYAWERIL